MSDHRTNKLLRVLNHKFLIQCILLLLLTNVASSSSIANPHAVTYQCAKSCECNQTISSARCDDVNELIASYKDDNRLHVLMPIKQLDLSNNQLEKVSHQLEILGDVEELNLSHNKLTQVQKLNFQNLQKLNLSNNRITAAKVKKVPRTVVELNLAYNEITYLPTEFMKFKQLRRLEMTGNPLNCTCDTLHVRNWLNTNNVWTDKIVCASPISVKGRPWLQVRQNDICFEPSSTTQQAPFKSKYNWDEYEDGNDIMMGDQPQDDDATDTSKADEEEKDYDAEETQPDAAADDALEEKDEDIFDDKENESAATNVTEEKPSDDDDNLIPVTPENEYDDHSESPVSDVSVHDEGSGADLPSSSPTSFDEGSGDDESSGNDEVAAIGIYERSTVQTHIASKIEVDPNVPDPDPATDTERASPDNKGTYVLLAILALCLIALMVFVMMKNKKEKTRNRRYDVEKHGGTELQDMDKHLLGKPTEKNDNSNGNGKAEHIPLMNGNGNNPSNDDKTYLDAPAITVDVPKDEQPRKLNGNGKLPAESIHEIPTKAEEAVDSPRKPVSSDSEDDSFHPAINDSLNVSPEPPKRYSPVYTSRSPPNERYSPVYSPETGRVKIKLTETPKPKTPVVVTRSRSGERDYVNTTIN